MKAIEFPLTNKEEAEALIERIQSGPLSKEDQQRLVKSLEFHLHLRSSVGKAKSKKHLRQLLTRLFSRKRLPSAPWST